MDSHLIEAAANTAEIHFNETVLSWSLYTPNTSNIDTSRRIVTADEMNHKIKEVNENIFQVHTQDANGGLKTYLTKKIVIAAGPWAPELYGDEISTSLSLHAERRVQLWFEPKTNKELFKVIVGPCAFIGYIFDTVI